MLRGHKDLKVYQLAYKLAMEIFNESKTFPVEERYSLTDQIRRSSRSVATNIAEAFRKRRYPNMFVNKLSDSDTEATETQVWLDTFDGAKHRFSNRGKKRRSVSTLSIPRALARGVEWVDFSLDCGYLSRGSYEKLVKGYEEVGKMLGSMMSTPEKFNIS